MRTIEEVVKDIKLGNFCETTEVIGLGLEDLCNEILEIHKAEQNRIDKIRTEIDELPDMDKAGVFSSVRMKDMVLQIIDKYKAESEGNNDRTI